MFALNSGDRRYVSDPRRGRVRRIVAILALAAAAGAARAQTIPPPDPLAKADAVANALADEAKLLPCTLNDVKGEFARLAQTGTLKMQALPCEAWVKLSLSDSYGDSPSAVSSAAGGDETIAFALTPDEASRLRSAGVASGQAVALNDVVTAVAVAPRTPGFTGVVGRLSRRFGEAGSVASKSLDGDRPFAAKAQYEDLTLWGNGGAGGAGGTGGLSSSSGEGVASAAGAFSPVDDPLNPEPHGSVVILTAADGPSALAARRSARTPHLQTDRASGEAAVTRPVSVDARSENTRRVGYTTGATQTLPKDLRVQRPAVGGRSGEAGMVADPTPLSVTSETVVGSFTGNVGEAVRAGVVPERLRRRERRR